MANFSSTYKVLLVGDSGVGKTTFLIRHLTGAFTTEHKSTLCANIKSLKFYTNYGPIILNICDCTGKQHSINDYYLDGQAALVFFDVTNPNSYDNVRSWANNVHSILPPMAPVIICGNKCDMRDRKVLGSNIAIHRTLSLEWDTIVYYYDISAKSNYNFVEPFLSIAKQLTGKEDLQFVPNPTIMIS